MALTLATTEFSLLPKYCNHSFHTTVVNTSNYLKNTYNNLKIPTKIIAYNILKTVPQEIQLQKTI